MEVVMRYLLRVLACTTLVALAGCSALNLFESRRVDYKSTANVPSLEVPPDLTMPAFDERYRDRPGSATASGLRWTWLSSNRCTDASRGNTEAVLFHPMRSSCRSPGESSGREPIARSGFSTIASSRV